MAELPAKNMVCWRTDGRRAPRRATSGWLRCGPGTGSAVSGRSPGRRSRRPCASSLILSMKRAIDARDVREVVREAIDRRIVAGIPAYSSAADDDNAGHVADVAVVVGPVHRRDELVDQVTLRSCNTCRARCRHTGPPKRKVTTIAYSSRKVERCSRRRPPRRSAAPGGREAASCCRCSRRGCRRAPSISIASSRRQRGRDALAPCSRRAPSMSSLSARSIVLSGQKPCVQSRRSDIRSGRDRPPERQALFELLQVEDRLDVLARRYGRSGSRRAYPPPGTGRACTIRVRVYSGRRS